MQVDSRDINIRIMRLRPDQPVQPSLYYGQLEFPPVYYNNTLRHKK